MDWPTAAVIIGILASVVGIIIKIIGVKFSEKGIDVYDSKLDKLITLNEGILNSIRTMNERSEINAKDIRDIYEMQRDLYEWHKKEDSDGRKIWYSSRELEKSTVAILQAVNESLRQVISLLELQEKNSIRHEKKLDSVIQKHILVE